MNVKIETYRGIEISFDTGAERFSYSFDTGHWNEKQSYAACKKSIDDYFKNNQNFVPFKVRHKYTGEVIEIIGIRKDNLFLSIEKGKKEQVSKYHESNYIEYNESDEQHYARIAVLELEIDKIEKSISVIRQGIAGKTLDEIKSKYINP